MTDDKAGRGCRGAHDPLPTEGLGALVRRLDIRYPDIKHSVVPTVSPAADSTPNAGAVAPGGKIKKAILVRGRNSLGEVAGGYASR